MSDLVQRLRALGTSHYSDGSGAIPICNEAADEIDRLTFAEANAMRAYQAKADECDRLTRELAESNANFRELLLTNGSMGERNIKLSFQNDRLRAALEEISERATGPYSAADIALHALRGEK